MTKSVYFTAAEGNSGTRPVARAVIEQLTQDYPKLGLFRAFTNGPIETDGEFVDLLKLAGREADLDIAWGTTRQAYVRNEDAAMTDLVKRYTDYAQNFDAVLILGLLDGDPVNPGVLARTGRAAANLAASVFVVVSGALRTPEQVVSLSHLVSLEIQGENAPISAVAVTSAERRVEEEQSPAGAHVPIIYLYDGEAVELTDGARQIVRASMEHGSDVVTPLSFTASLIARARAQRKRIVLPESADDRILRAADELIRREVADITLLGEREDVLARRATRSQPRCRRRGLPLRPRSHREVRHRVRTPA